MKKRHIMVALLAGVMVASMLAGCSSQPVDTRQDILADTSPDHIEAWLKEKGLD